MIIIGKFIDKVNRSKFFIFIDQMIYRIQDDAIFPVGGQMAYFLVLSIFPFIMVFLNILSFTELVQEDVLLSMIQYLPEEVKNIIIGFVKEVVSTSSQGFLSLAAILGIWTASSGIRAVIRAINRAYGYKETRSYFTLRFMSVVFTVAILVLLTLVFATIVFGELIGTKLFALFGKTDLFMRVWTKFRLIIPFLFMILIFALLYKFSPSSKDISNISLKSTLPGAIFATLGWMITSVGFSYYVSNFGKFTVTYGSLVGVILLLIWLYISSIIILLGGEINATLRYLNINGYKVHPEKSFAFGLEGISELKEEIRLKRLNKDKK